MLQKRKEQPPFHHGSTEEKFSRELTSESEPLKDENQNRGGWHCNITITAWTWSEDVKLDTGLWWVCGCTHTRFPQDPPPPKWSHTWVQMRQDKLTVFKNTDQMWVRLETLYELCGERKFWVTKSSKEHWKCGRWNVSSDTVHTDTDSRGGPAYRGNKIQYYVQFLLIVQLCVCVCFNSNTTHFSFITITMITMTMGTGTMAVTIWRAWSQQHNIRVKFISL